MFEITKNKAGERYGGSKAWRGRLIIWKKISENQGQTENNCTKVGKYDKYIWKKISLEDTL